MHWPRTRWCTVARNRGGTTLAMGIWQASEEPPGAGDARTAPAGPGRAGDARAAQGVRTGVDADQDRVPIPACETPLPPCEGARPGAGGEYLAHGSAARSRQSADHRAPRQRLIPGSPAHGHHTSGRAPGTRGLRDPTPSVSVRNGKALQVRGGWHGTPGVDHPPLRPDRRCSDPPWRHGSVT